MARSPILQPAVLRRPGGWPRRESASRYNSSAEEIIIRWTPGHSGIPGNEEADEHAKRAASGDLTNPSKLPVLLRKRNTPRTLPGSKSARKRVFTTKETLRSKKIFESSPRAELARRIDPSLPSSRFLELVEGLPKRQAAALFQLRTGHAPLNSHLHRINKAATPYCTLCPHQRRETVIHFLLECPHHEQARTLLRHKLRHKASEISSLLADPKCVKQTLAFIHATGRFKTTFHDLTPPRDPA